MPFTAFKQGVGRAIGLALLISPLLPAIAGAAKPGRQTDTAEALLIVDCVLPGQLRQLGRRTTYLSARRAIRTTAKRCRVRGGEYVLRDDSSLGAAIAVWQGQAEEGDVEAQVTLGELLESGTAGAADPASARLWYQRAAEQGSTRAMVALGNLLERGQGGPTDTVAALHWYQRAAGSSKLALEPTPDLNPMAAKLAQERNLLVEQVEQLRASQQNLAELNAQLAQQLATETSATAAEAEAKNAQLLELKARFAAQQDANAALEVQLLALNRTQQQTLEERRALEAALANARQENERAQQQLRAELERTTDSRRTTSSTLEATVDTTLDTTLDTALDTTLANLEEREASLAEALRKIDQLTETIGDLNTARTQQRSSTAASLQQANARPAPMDAIARPEIVLIEPQMAAGARGLVKLKAPAALMTKDRPGLLVGKVSAAAGLLALTANQQPLSPNAAGIFQFDLRNLDTAALRLTAIDQLGKRADLTIRLGADNEQAPALTRSLPKVNLGRYHALLIANSAYRQLPALQTPDADVNRVSELLKRRYGFETEIIRNTTRYELLSALNRYREQMTADDNLLIYYAGHGELDRRNMRGHWLPVDAELTSTANWVSNTDVTDILNLMNTKHVMLVVDSCYSGTLTRSGLTRLDSGMTPEEERSWLELVATKRARVALSSGGLAPVLDYGGGEHSVFARAFIDTIAANQDVLPGRSLHQAVAARVAHGAANLEFEQLPEYAPISRAGHEAGDFVLLPKRR